MVRLSTAASVVGAAAEAVLVEFSDRRVLDRGRLEAVAVRAGPRDTRRLVFPPRLVGRDLLGLRGALLAAEHLDALVSVPRELVVVPHRNERPAGARVLQVGVGEVGTVHRAVVRERHGQVVVAELVAVRVFEKWAQAAAAVLALRHLVRVIHHLVDEVAEVQHEAELLGARAALVLVDHAAIGVRGADRHVLAAHEREAHRARVALAGCS